MPIANTSCVPDAENFSDSDLQDLTSLLENDELSYEFLRDIFHTDDQITDQPPQKTLIDLDPPTATEDQCPTVHTHPQSPYSQSHPVENISTTSLQPATIQNTFSSFLNQYNTNNESSSSNTDTNTSVKNAVFDLSMSKWASKHPRQWTTDDVLDWLYSAVEKEGVDLSRLRGEAFQNVTGVQLCNMSEEEFTEKEPEYGGLLFKSFQRLIDSTTTVPAFNSTMSECQYNEQKVDSVSTTNSILLGNGLAVINATFHGGWMGSMPDIQKLQQSEQQSQTVTNSILISATNGSCLPLPASGPYRYPRPITSSFKPKRRPGRPRIRNLLSDAEIEQEKQKKRMKNQHLWEFLYDALKNPGYNPRLVKWENEMEGVFRFVQSEMMAHVWGNLKNNGNMNYEKLSRAMRHYYRRGILERVEGRRLVYKFSKTAIDKLKSRPNIT